MSERSDGTHRLRRAGVGVIIGGICLGAFSVLTPYRVASGLVLALGVVGGLNAYRVGRSVQLFVGVSAIGGIGLLETGSGVGLGLGPFELAAIAVVFGLVDVVVGTVLDRYKSDSTR